MAFWAELRQRKVVRVGAAYAVCAWVIAQVASLVLPTFGAPDWVLRVLILVLGLGLPLALVLAWAVDLTPEGPRFAPGGTGWKRLLAISTALGALALGWYFYGQPALRGDQQAVPKAAVAAPAATPARTANPRSIAVLPFVNMSRDPANEYFSDGLAETTLDMLAQVHDLKVIARTSSFAFKGRNDDVRTIGRKLDAAHLLEGSVQQAGKTVRITAQLVRTSDGTHLWSKRFDREMTDVFAIQDEIAAEVVKALQVALPAGEAQRLTGGRTKDLVAYQEYLRGLALLPKRRVADLKAAVVHFERAIARDAAYAEAHAAASIALSLVENYGGTQPAEAEARQRRHFEEALRLDPKLGEAWAARGAWFNRRGKIMEARESYQRATELAPNYAGGFQWMGELLMLDFGLPDEALPMYARALELDPLSPIVRNEYANALAVVGRHDEALQRLQALVRDAPDFVGGYRTLSRLHEWRGDLVAALRANQEARRVDPAVVNMGLSECWLLSRYSAVALARACFEREARPPVLADDVASVRARMAWMAGRPEEALAIAQASPRDSPWERVNYLVELKRYPEALRLLQGLDPGMFVQPEPRLTSAYPGDAVVAGVALVGSGAKAQGQDLLRRALRDNAKRPIAQIQFGRRWMDAWAWTALGDLPRACTALREVAASGFYLDISDLDMAAGLAPLRAQPCYEQALAPARARAAAQVEAARKAGLITDVK